MSHGERGVIEDRLCAAGCVAAVAEAEELLAAASGPETLESWTQRRERGEPLAWITGRTTFCGHVIHVAPGVYVPRPHSEELARRARALLPERGRAADLCTGSGAIAVHLTSAHPTATVVGVDIDAAAVVVARRNGVAAAVGDLDGPLRTGAFDVVTAVVPYVPTPAMRFLASDARHEPHRALDGGPDGLDVVRRAISGAARLLRPGGWFLTELGGEQHRLVTSVLAAAGFEPPTEWFDDDGDLRGIAARRA